MKLEWMGEDREIIRWLIRYANLYARFQAVRLADGEDLPLSSQEWQTLECILEFEGENLNMAALADKLGIPTSNFSKYVKTLVEHGLVERYRRAGNRKDIILLPSPEGRGLYERRSRLLAREWARAFALAAPIAPGDKERFAAFLRELGRGMDGENGCRPELQRI